MTTERTWHLPRLAAFNKAVEAEFEAIVRGDTERSEAGDRLAERFFPHLSGADRDAQPARMSGGAN